ncbi:centrosomal protein of 131 kDa isoform X2 [Nematostella vectensis]|uniref:centrosomal protein of 131 kDa isoform X2 n=1 Tax=Nematostella vectensis TaxID=45351 RepID=UPI0020773B78|nr:centrosomal protein of 131 kDa isoform X2 [Nematostella vectensis]
MNSKNLAASFGSGRNSSSKTRPNTAKGSRSTASTGRYSSRSDKSVESDMSDLLSITGTPTAKQPKTVAHPRTGSSSSQWRPEKKVQHDISDGESDRTSGSGGARRKAPNKLDQGGNLRNQSKKSKSQGKKPLAADFKINSPDRQSSSKPTETINDAEEDWWPGSSINAQVPPLLELRSLSEEEEHKPWWHGNKSQGPEEDQAMVNSEFKLWTGKSNDSDPLVDAINEMLQSPGDGSRKSSAKSNDSAAKNSPVPKLFLGNGSDDDIISRDSRETQAAITIQRWVRGWRVRRWIGQGALKHLLGQKKKEVLGNLAKSKTQEDLEEMRQAEKVKRREEKARLARQAAIEELQKKREEKKQENQRKAEDEMKFLQASGKVSKKKSNSRPKSAKPARPVSSLRLNNEAASASKGPSPSLPGSSRSTERKVDELFQESRASQAVKSVSFDDEHPLPSDRTESTSKNAGSDVNSKTTFDDLLNSLKQLEQEPEELLSPGIPAASDHKLNSWLDEIDKDNEKPYLSVANVDSHNHHKVQSDSSTALSAEKLRNIIHFLDEVEKAEEDVRSEITQVREEAISRGLPSPSASTSITFDKEKERAALEEASHAATDVTNAMMAVKIELEEKKRTNELLQRALNQQREFTLRQAKEMEKDAKQRLTIQKQEYEAAIQRHLSFIDQLIDDKKTLGERCEELVKKLKDIDKKYSDKIKLMEENHQVEIKKQKEVILAAEKLRREKWITEKTQQIKEVTVKGLEPDIQKLIAKHKAEVKKIKSVQQAELLESDERAGRRYIQQIEELRDQLEREKEMACTRERELAQQRMEKQMEQEEQAYQQQRRRLYSEVQEEKERIALQAQRQRQELDDARRALEESHKKTVTESQASHQKSLEDIERRHQLEMNELKERLEVEKQAWIENYMKKQDTVLMAKERELKEGVREARDREIEMVINRLEDEAAASREECERAAENRIKRVRDKYESEIRELERSESNMQQRYNEMKERLTEVEGELSRQRSLLRHKDTQQQDSEQTLTRLQEERGKVADIIRQEFADRLVTTDEDNKRLKTELSEMRARHRLELERITREKEEEMEQVHTRVKQAISKKEETMKVLREQQQAAMKRADHLEMLLQQQRKKLLP